MRPGKFLVCPKCGSEIGYDDDEYSAQRIVTDVGPDWVVDLCGSDIHWHIASTKDVPVGEVWFISDGDIIGKIINVGSGDPANASE